MKLSSKKMGILILFLLFAFPVYAQSLNETPMYGGQSKSPELQKADQDFIAKAIEAAGSREKAAQAALRKGWESIDRNDPVTAVKRFNQAWLLTPNSGDVFWGFGAAMGQQGKLDESIKFLAKANAIKPNNGRLLCDFGFSYIWKGKSVEKSVRDADVFYNKAVSLLKQASTVEPRYERIYTNWAIVLFFKNDYKGAWEKVKQAESLGGRTLDKNFLNDLSSRMGRPS